MRPGLALAAALAAIVVIAASATAVPPTTTAPVTGGLVPFTLPIDARPGRGPTWSPDQEPLDALLAPASRALGEPGVAPIPTLAPRRQPAPAARAVRKEPPAPRTSHVLRGTASWYCNNDGSRAQTSACHHRYPDTGGFDAYAAAGPMLRAALGGGERWRGRVVLVDGIRVKLVDWCQCYKGQANEKVIDLYHDVFRRTGSAVTIRW